MKSSRIAPCVVVSGLVLWMMLPAAGAASEPELGAVPKTYGLEWNDLWLTGEDFLAESPDLGLMESNGSAWWTNNGADQAVFRAHLVLPNGSLMDGFWVVHWDDNASETIIVALLRHRYDLVANDQDAAFLANFYRDPAEMPGMVADWFDLNPDHTYRHRTEGDEDSAEHYIFQVTLPPTDTVKFRGVLVRWKRLISPAPALATFADVPVGAFGFQHVEALAASGITAGCGGGNFCPNQPLTRVQMAVFLAKALGLHWAP